MSNEQTHAGNLERAGWPALPSLEPLAVSIDAAVKTMQEATETIARLRGQAAADSEVISSYERDVERLTKERNMLRKALQALMLDSVCPLGREKAARFTVSFNLASTALAATEGGGK